MIKPQYSTEQEAFWAGAFGSGYIGRNRTPRQMAGNLALFAEILKPLPRIRSVLEIGANVGNNLRALSLLLPDARLGAVEINGEAVEVLREWGGVAEIHHQSILDFEPAQALDVRGLQFAETAPPGVDRLSADLVLSGDLGNGRLIGFPQDRNHLIFGKTTLLHGLLAGGREPFSQVTIGPKNLGRSPLLTSDGHLALREYCQI